VQNVVTYDAVIDVANPNLELKPGMTATVTFVVASRDDVLKLANAALRFRPPAGLVGSASASASGGARAGRSGRPGGSGKPGDSSAPSGAGSASPAGPGEVAGPPADRKTVYLLRDNVPQAVRIRVGITDGTDTEIVDGDLKEGDLVITAASGAGVGTGSPSSSRGGTSPGQSPAGGARRMF